MFVKVMADRRDASRVMAMIDGVPAFFQKGTKQPLAGTDVEVMIASVKHPYGKHDAMLDFSKVSCYILKVVDMDQNHLDGLFRVRFSGFETSGSMCTTQSRATRLDGSGPVWLTPGRVGVATADNVNVQWQKKQYVLTPGTGWAEHVYGRRMPRLVGVDELKYLEVFSERLYVEIVSKPYGA